MSIVSWHRSRILAIWLVAVALAIVAVRVGDALRLTMGRATGFYVGSLFLWIVWVAWLVTWCWTLARAAEARDRRLPWPRILLVLLLVAFAVLWLAATILEYM